MDPATRLVRRLAVLPEAAMREAVLVEALGALPPAEAVDVLARVTDRAARDDADHRLAIATLAGALERLPYAVRRDLYEAAKAARAETIARLFFGSPPGAEPPPPAPEQFVAATGRTVTLGERKTLARGGRRDLV